MLKIIKISIFLVMLSLVCLGAFGVVWYFAALRPVDPGKSNAQVFRLDPGTSTTTAASALQQANLIRNKYAFNLYISLHGLRGKVKAGAYSLSRAKSTSDIVAIITQGEVFTDKIVVPEGYTVLAIETVVSGKGISKADFEQAIIAAYPSTVLSDRPDGADLEGYLFPDSYTITGNTSAKDLVGLMVANTEHQITPDLAAGFRAQGLNIHQALTLASIIEKEVAKPADRPIVAQVFLTRLKAGIALGSDVTVNYGAAKLGKSFDTQLNSPYNTYKYKGLPPGPICNPGLSAMQAVAKPATTSFLYFLAGKDGTTYFAKDYAEHQQNIVKYLK